MMHTEPSQWTVTANTKKLRNSLTLLSVEEEVHKEFSERSYITITHMCNHPALPNMAVLALTAIGLLSILPVCGPAEHHGGFITDERSYDLTKSDEIGYGDMLLEDTYCPTWLHRNGSGACVCGSSIHNTIHCDSNTNQTSILACYCMTTDGRDSQVVVGACVYNCFNATSYTRKDTVYHDVSPNTSSLDHQMCSHLNRNGTLCGECRPGYYLAPYTYDLQCFNCTYSPWNWVWYIAVAYGPLTVFFIIIVSCRISVVSGQITSFVNFSQILSVSINLRVVLAGLNNRGNLLGPGWFVKTLAALYGIWNLDFFRTLVPPICLNVTSLQATALDYGIAVYPLILIVITYILVELDERNFRIVVWAWRPFHRCFTRLRNRWDAKTSIIDAFATFLFLSYMKVLSVSSDILIYGRLYEINGNQLRKYVFYNASVEYLSEEHLPYAITAITVLIIFVFLPLILLLLYPLRTFQRFLDYCHLRTPMLTTLVDSIQGCYKDGTNGTRDFRYFSATYIILRITIVGMYALTLDVYAYSLFNILAITVAIVYLVLQPYKKMRYNYFDAVIFLVMAMWCTSVTALSIATARKKTLVGLSFIMVFVFSAGPLVYASVMFQYWMVVQKRFPQRTFLSTMRFLRVARFRSCETFIQSLPHRLLYPNQYNRVAPLAYQVSPGGEDESDDDSASDRVSEELWSAHNGMYSPSEEESDSESELSIYSH